MSARRMGSKERATQCLISLPMACYHAVHDMPGGVGALAGAHGKNAAVLQNKLNPNMPGHALNISELEMIIASTGDARILQSICAMFGAGYFFLPDVGVDDGSLFTRAAELLREVSELMETITHSMADGAVSADEVAALDKALLELHAAGQGLVAAVKKAGGAA